MKQTQLCLASISLLIASGQPVLAGGPDLGDWIVSDGTESTDAACFDGSYTCGNAITGNGFFQRQATDEDDGGDYFQTIITDTGPTDTEEDNYLVFSDEAYLTMMESNSLITDPPSSAVQIEVPELPPINEDPLGIPKVLYCPTGHECSNIVFGEGYEQQEFTDGDNLWLQSVNTGESNASISTSFSSWDSTPLHLFHTNPKVTLKPGPYLSAMDSRTLQRQPKNLQLERDDLPLDPDHTELNQQSTAEQQIYNKVLDVELAERVIGRTIQLGAQLNAPLNIPDSYQLQLRILTHGAWNDFIIIGNNFVSSAVKLDTGFCPDIDSDIYKNTFGSGSECLRISIQDGGINDSDSTIDGRIELTMGVILKATELQATPLSNDSSTKAEIDQTQIGSGGGGSWSLFLSIFIILRCFSNNISTHYFHSTNRLE